MNYSDFVRVVDVSTGYTQLVDLVMADFRSVLFTHPTGPQEVISDTIVDLTSNAAKYKNVLTLPAGCVMKYAAAIITEAVTGGSTTVKLALGANGGTVNSWGVLSALTVGTKVATCFADKVASSVGLDLNGVTTAGTALGDTNITAGKVRVVVIYDKPVDLS